MAAILRTGASRGILRSLNTTTIFTSTPMRQQFRSKLCTISNSQRPLAFTKPLAPKTLQSVKYATSRDPVSEQDLKREDRMQQKTLKADPEHVSATSTTIPAMDMSASDKGAEADPDMMAGIRHDLDTIRQTFSLEDVPKQAYYMGMAGVLPYMATSLSTVYCAWEINHAAEYGAGFLLNEQAAETMLHIIEPIQVGYGAVILSFLGAIHWGLEWAQYGGTQGYPRYAIGVVATAVGWPTILLPIEYALITQFLGFVFLYYTDVRAKTRGWAPPWYGIYRFVLTFIVGGSIMISLIGRGQIADRIGHVPSTAERIRAFQMQAEPVEDEEAARRKYLGDEDEGEDDEDDE